MFNQILGYLIEFAVQTAFLLVALWVMIVLQKLHWNFLGMLGAAALASGLDMIPYVGHYLSVAALLTCVRLLSRPDSYTDVLFTVAVAYALMFCMNLFVVGALLGDLRPNSTDRKDNVADVPAKVAPAKTNAPAVAPVKAAAVTNAPTNVAAPAAVTTKTNELSPAEIAKQAMAKFSLKGVNKSANQPLAMVNTGVRTYTVAVGESTLVETPKGKFTMHCDEVTDNKATLSINGQQTTLFLHY